MQLTAVIGGEGRASGAGIAGRIPPSARRAARTPARTPNPYPLRLLPAHRLQPAHFP